MMTKYPAAFIAQALVKAFSRGKKSITLLTEELNVNHHTLRYWMKNKSAIPAAAAGTKEKRPQDWTPAEQLVPLQESLGWMTQVRHADHE